MDVDAAVKIVEMAVAVMRAVTAVLGQVHCPGVVVETFAVGVAVGITV